ncbi:MAG: iron-sulfur cluster assembly scaffold protein [Candidatus Pacebacteria bacterium]|nr:iron-sulfur cluster assembly scaffold protein [Candidatus Paceibacterota bacterium]
MDLPPIKQKPLIYALWKGDGYVNLNREGPRAEYCTISYNLAQQIKTLLLRQKIAPSVYIDKAKKIKGINHKKSYRIHIGQRDSLIKLCALLNTKYRPQSYASEKAWFNNNYLHIPITNIKKKNHTGKVYNLEVKNSHCFTSEAFCLHNCGDVMWLYIKVNKNKKGEEIIKNIKFETFGCVAAIATSSIITDIAKGKTIAEAIKLNKDNIIDTLEELPPVKIHCSVLAIDALQEAIYEYLKKNKKTIPQELEKHHQRIQNEKKMIEKKYAGWIE